MKKLAIGLYVLITVALMVWGYYQAIYVAPNDAMQGEIFRIIYYHVPSASVAFVFFAVSLVGSIGYLSSRRNYAERAQMFDAWALSAEYISMRNIVPMRGRKYSKRFRRGFAARTPEGWGKKLRPRARHASIMGRALQPGETWCKRLTK